MISFCLFESHGRIVLLEELTPEEASAIFKKFGAKEADISSRDARKAFFKKLSKAYHPDVNQGDRKKEVQFKELSAANDMMKTLPDDYFDIKGSMYGGRNNGFTDFRKHHQEPEERFPAWQTDSLSTFNSISKQDCTNMNFFKKSMWELSGKSRDKFTIWAFDGTFFRSCITVYGSEAIYEAMAKGMVVWNSYGANPYKTRAVFVHNEEWPAERVDLIYLDNDYSYAKHPIMFEHESNNLNPSNDRRFERELPAQLDEITQDK